MNTIKYKKDTFRQGVIKQDKMSYEEDKVKK